MSTTIEHTVMSRVHRIHTLRRVFSATACKVYGLVLFVLGLFSSVSVVSVYANMPSFAAPTASLRYLGYALMQTELLVKVLTLGLVTVALLLARDLFRSLGRVSLPFRHA